MAATYTGDDRARATARNHVDAARRFIDSAQFYLGGVVDHLNGARRTRVEEVLDTLSSALADLDRVREAL